jgi:hypothetical protein
MPELIELTSDSVPIGDFEFDVQRGNAQRVKVGARDPEGGAQHPTRALA